MFDEVVLETETGRVAGLVSKNDTRLSIVFQPGAPALEVRQGKDYQQMRFPSLTFLRRVAPDFLIELWSSEPDYVLHLALEQLPAEKRTSREAGSLLRKGPETQNADAKKLAPLFKKLVAEGIAKPLGGSPEKVYELLTKASTRVPEQFAWLAKGQPGAIELPGIAKADESNETLPTEQIVTEGQKLPKGTANQEEAAEPPSVMDYLAALLDAKSEKPADLEEWISSPFERACEVAALAKPKLKLVVKQPMVVGYPLFVLLESGLWDESTANIAKVNKIKSTALLKTISSYWEKDWELLPHLEGLTSQDFEPAKGTSALDLLKVLAVMGKAGLRDSKLAARALGSLLGASKPKFNSERDGSLIPLAISSFSPGNSRSDLIIKAITTWGMPPTVEQLRDYTPLELLAFLERYDLKLGGRGKARQSASYTGLMQVVSEVLTETLQRVGDESALAAVIRLQSGYILDLDPKLMASFILSSLGRDERLRPIAQTMSGMNQLAPLERERDELRAQITTQSTQLKSLSEDFERVSGELSELRKRSLSDRKDQIQSNKTSAQEAATPLLRILARSLSAAHEFLGDNTGAIGRFEIIADQAGLARIGEPGQEVTFDPLIHSDPESEIQTGDRVTVHNVGFKLEDGGSEKILLKAIVVKK